MLSQLLGSYQVVISDPDGAMIVCRCSAHLGQICFDAFKTAQNHLEVIFSGDSVFSILFSNEKIILVLHGDDHLILDPLPMKPHLHYPMDANTALSLRLPWADLIVAVSPIQ